VALHQNLFGSWAALLEELRMLPQPPSSAGLKEKVGWIRQCLMGAASPTMYHFPIDLMIFTRATIASASISCRCVSVTSRFT